MPNYNYRCDHCKHTFIRMFSMAQVEDSVLCENCGKPAMKVFSVSKFTIHGAKESNGYTIERKQK